MSTLAGGGWAERLVVRGEAGVRACTNKNAPFLNRDSFDQISQYKKDLCRMTIRPPEIVLY